jgi:uncharacterized protein (TIGR02271 family)
MREHETRIRQGMKVYSADGESLGKVVYADGGGFRIEKGLFFPKDYDISYQEVREIRDDEIHLSLDRKTLEQGVSASEQREGRSAKGIREEVRVPLSEEHLEASKRVEETGRVKVSKETVTEEETVRVPVTREEVRVERVPARGEPGEGAFEDEEIEIPIREERAEVRKRPQVREEVRVGKTRHEKEETRREPVRKERAVVEEEEAKKPGIRATEREESKEGYRAPPPRRDDH